VGFVLITNAFSKKIDNHFWAIALHYMHYNFCRIHKSLRVTPAMEAGITDHVWSIEEIAELLENEIKAFAKCATRRDSLGTHKEVVSLQFSDRSQSIWWSVAELLGAV
jgi:hypothetical protein